MVVGEEDEHGRPDVAERELAAGALPEGGEARRAREGDLTIDAGFTILA
jgi:hypothetical protein